MTPYMNLKLMAEAGERDRLSLSSKLDRVTAESGPLQERLNEVDQKNDDLQAKLVERDVPVVTADQILGAYQFASFEPAKHLRGTTAWCAAFAQELNYRIGADTAEVERIAKELRETREECDGLRRIVDEFQSRSHGIKNLSVIEQLNDQLAERDALLLEAMRRINVNQNHEFILAIEAALDKSTEGASHE